ncbi:MAG TPA: phenylalanine--tRNA ligase subunit alpha [Candidatus Saccharimonadales bacterium]|nr:phenylalanine--tRNA ligase subunit alpha [Candidatus Saccharimonadales bacterium]
MSSVADTDKLLKQRFQTLDDKRAILRAPELKQLYAGIKNIPAEERRAYGQAINVLKQELETLVEGYEAAQEAAALTPIDVTAPFDINAAKPALLGAQVGSRHPLSVEREVVADIFARMGYNVMDSRQIDDDYHMFGALNFPEGHPARDDYDTFVTEEGLIAPAHTSTMQNRVLKSNQPPIRTVVIGRVFRNEDLDAKHEHTLNQVEGVFVGKKINVGHLLATLKTFLETYYKTDIEFRTQPSYFPFVEPGFEFSLSCPFCHKAGCATCGHEGWIELIGCGMIHPNVLREGGINPKEYTGFAWGFGLDRLVMMKYGIEDIRHFQSGKLAFLRQFK